MTTTEEQGPVITEEAVPVWNGRLTIRVKVAGAGAPVVYLHPAGGLRWDPFLSHIAHDHTVYAVEFPGTSTGDPYAIHLVDRLSDVVLIYEEVLRTLGLIRPVIIGQSFGGMLAAELVAAYPDIASRVVLLDPLGLWREDLPIANWLATAPTEMPALLFHDPTGPVARAMLTPPEDPDIAAAAIAAQTWAIGSTGKFVFPIPERGLRARLHRVTAPVLVVWGRHDNLIPADYAEEWKKELADVQIAIIDDCGHVPQAEKLEETLTVVEKFLTA